MSSQPFTMEDLLREMVRSGASDVHLKAHSAPGFRIDGEIVLQDRYGVMEPEDTQRLAYELLTQEQIAVFEQMGDLDCSFSVPNCARFRVNILTARETTGIVIRQIPEQIPSMRELRLPKICTKLASKPRGLVLVTGPTGSGKSTTLAAMIDSINEKTKGHILTMEDPLEFIHKDKGCFVTQRQIGADCKDFKQALRRALRQDPDVILIGEMRDLETIELAITAAETGHLVLGTLHTTSAISTVDRIVDVFPPDAQAQVRAQLASTLQGVISQTLCSKIGGGRVAAHEILVATDGVRSLIREGKTPQILNFLQTGSKHGMVTLEQSLINLVNDGLISADDAKKKANRPDEIAAAAFPEFARTPSSGVQGSSNRRSSRASEPDPKPTTRPTFSARSQAKSTPAADSSTSSADPDFPNFEDTNTPRKPRPRTLD